jgi:D-alanyl-D-alanine carboxypeptidase/D-alanyl-D-alanine-endopeptidase (penicillin-binding protein 4)
VETAVYQDVRLELPEKIVWIEHNNYYLPVGNTSSVDPKSEKVAVKAKSIFDTSKRYFYQSPFTHRMAFTEKFDANSLVTTIPAARLFLGTLSEPNLLRVKSLFLVSF